MDEVIGRPIPGDQKKDLKNREDKEEVEMAQRMLILIDYFNN